MTKAILVLNGPSYGNALGAMGPKVMDYNEFLTNPKEFRMVLFTGGADVTPSFYGHTSPEGRCQSDLARDHAEQRVFRIALENDIPMIGICRGLQFLNVMAGGTLIHHLDGHGNGTHYMECQRDEKIILVNSLHHQMIVPPKDAYITAWSTVKLSNAYYGDEDKPVSWFGPEVEAAVFPKIRACGVQYHPEMMAANSSGQKFFFDMAYDIMYKTIDTFVDIYTGRLKAYV
jgi:gamma-glutamyl-gamma-aminobutyrate hydrolase PuuD